MKKNIILLLSITLLFGLIACSSENNKDDREVMKKKITDDTMTGYLLHIDKQKNELHLDISKWRNQGETEVHDMMYSKTIKFNENTTFQDEQGLPVQLEDFKKGEKLAIFVESDPSSSNLETVSLAMDIVKLEMSKAEKLDRFLAKGSNFHTVVIYQEGTIPPYDEMDFEKHVPESFSGGISWVPYVEGLAIDYKKELSLEKLPMILVFDRKGVVFQTDTMDQLKSWSAESRGNL